ncbi:acyl-CoA carboxylase subunit beta [Candidatus Babeliales bacterium]|nr:acyl-CoA carboxylase subunit beta [Candidatus Babeliales bacterium]
MKDSFIFEKNLLNKKKEIKFFQKNSSKYTAKTRLEILLDQDSFQEIDQLVSSPFIENAHQNDGVITGFGTINNQKVAVYSQDFNLKGGSVGKFHAQKICKIMDLAAKIGCPIVGVIDSGGARIQEGIHSLAGYGEIFLRNVRYSGIIPQISIILGPCAGGATYSPALTDFIFTVEKISNLFVTGPNVIQQVLHQTINKEDLGGALVHNQISGLCHIISQSEDECFEHVKQLLSYLPNNYKSQTNINSHEIFFNNTDLDNTNNIDLENVVPQNNNLTYNIKDVINNIFDINSFFEIQELFAQNIVIGFAKLDGIVTGIVANQPQVNAGSIDINASCKAARFINFCNSFSIPIISLVDVPGFMPGIEQEHNGIIRHGAKLIYAYAHATVPKITVILRKAYGGAYIVMGSKHLGTDFNFSWPNTQIAVLGAKSAIAILHGKKLNNIHDEEEKEILQKDLESQYEKEFLNPDIAAKFGYIDSVIEPNQTRDCLIKALKMSLDKVEKLLPKKSGNMPL